jgi:uncharacterized protein (DUF849 family)
MIEARELTLEDLKEELKREESAISITDKFVKMNLSKEKLEELKKLEENLKILEDFKKLESKKEYLVKLKNKKEHLEKAIKYMEKNNIEIYDPRFKIKEET